MTVADQRIPQRCDKDVTRNAAALETNAAKILCRRGASKHKHGFDQIHQMVATQATDMHAQPLITHIHPVYTLHL